LAKDLGYRIKSFYWPHTKALNRIGPHSYEFCCVAVGLLLSDGHAELHGNGVRICFSQCRDHYDFFNALSTFFFNNGYVSRIERPTLVRNNTGVAKLSVAYQYQLRTYTFAYAAP
jgi:hypothetical protein